MTESKVKLRDISIEELHSELKNRFEYAKKEFYPICHSPDEKLMIECIYRARGAMFVLNSLISFLECDSPSVDKWEDPSNTIKN